MSKIFEQIISKKENLEMFEAMKPLDIGHTIQIEYLDGTRESLKIMGKKATENEIRFALEKQI